MEVNTTLRPTTKDNNIKTGDIVVHGLKGIFRVCRIQQMKIEGKEKSYFQLEDLNSKTLHKNFIQCDRMKELGVRPVANKTQVEELDRYFFEEGIELAVSDWNSEKKMNYYNLKIDEDGFYGLVEAYLASLTDLRQATREERRLQNYNTRILQSLVNELTYIFDGNAQMASNTITKLESLFLGQ